MRGNLAKGSKDAVADVKMALNMAQPRARGANFQIAKGRWQRGREKGAG